MDDVSAQERQRIPADKGENSSSSDDEEDEASKQLWAKVECVLEEYHLSRFALAAAKRWVRLMGGAYDIASPSRRGMHAECLIATHVSSCPHRSQERALGTD